MAVNTSQQPILITGGTTGIGRATVELLASRGHQVYATVRKDTDFEELNNIENVEAIKLDVTNLDQIDTLVEFIKNKGNGLFAVVNNSGVTDMIAINEMDDDDFDYLMKVNLYGPFRVTKALHEFIIESKGRIVNIGSIAGTLSPLLMGAYSISKHAIEAYSDTLSAEMEKFEVHVSTIEPGNYQSNIAVSAGKRIYSKIESRRKTKYREELMERISDPNAKPDRSHYKGPGDVADAIYDALFSENPRPRYMVVPDLEEGTETIKQKVKELVELNEWHEYSFSREQLIAMLDEFI
ncbi:MAG: SDR family NAD(P)-dependent oxidoreductase [Candidatus Heimdallarchaeota archaeon]|nr:SDR family NAD(P)-dependent oxidoreductase [Candidatus Heimdallarchaeota archaeon]